jgi:hypothetical protein
MIDYPIIPPPELEKQWFAAWESGEHEELSFADFVIPRAAQWGADQELEACCEWLEHKVLLQHQTDVVPSLRAARRPKPLNLKQRALRALAVIIENGHLSPDLAAEIRAVVEAADD